MASSQFDSTPPMMWKPDESNDRIMDEFRRQINADFNLNLSKTKRKLRTRGRGYIVRLSRD